MMNRRNFLKTGILLAAAPAIVVSATEVEVPACGDTIRFMRHPKAVVHTYRKSPLYYHDGDRKVESYFVTPANQPITPDNTMILWDKDGSVPTLATKADTHD